MRGFATPNIDMFGAAGRRAKSLLRTKNGAHKSIHWSDAMNYVDGVLAPVPVENMAAYKKLARKAARIWKEHGALAYVECVADDVEPGKWTSFPQSVKLKEGETVVFAWIVYKSRRDRDRINKLVMADPRMKPQMVGDKMPFDGKRMMWGGFKVMIEQ
jgi:uncharacterized protein YbaA (DUF1428 family)